VYSQRVANRLKQKSHHINLFASFAFFGLVAAGIDLCIFGGLIWINLDPVLANVISSSVGIFINYFLVSTFTFDVDYRNMINMIVFFTIAVVLLFQTSIFLSWMIISLNVNPLAAKLVTLPLSAVVKYALNRRFTFNKVTKHSE